MTPDITTKEDAIKRIEYLEALKDKVCKLTDGQYSSQELLRLFNEEYHKEQEWEKPYKEYFADLDEKVKTTMKILDDTKKKPRKVQQAFNSAHSEFTGCLFQEIMRIHLQFDITVNSGER